MFLFCSWFCVRLVALLPCSAWVLDLAFGCVPLFSRLPLLFRLLLILTVLLLLLRCVRLHFVDCCSLLVVVVYVVVMRFCYGSLLLFCCCSLVVLRFVDRADVAGDSVCSGCVCVVGCWFWCVGAFVLLIPFVLRCWITFALRSLV